MCVHDHRPTPFALVTLAGWLATGIILIVSSAFPSWGATLVIPALSTSCSPQAHCWDWAHRIRPGNASHSSGGLTSLACG